MSRSLVEKYEQMLSQDPSSTVFVELAKAFIERGDTAGPSRSASRVCRTTPSRSSGRVLWGKALINLGKASEAMNQFDLAVNIDRENPHAYNLISEVLLRKGLYRSALPILRKAATLQPNDGRIKQWLEQTKAALTGGPAPVLGDEAPVEEAAAAPKEEPAPEPKPKAEAKRKAEPARRDEGREAPTSSMRLPEPQPPLGDDAMPTVVTQAYEPANGRDNQVTQAISAPGLDAPPTEVRSEQGELPSDAELPVIQGEVDVDAEPPTQQLAALPQEPAKKRAPKKAPEADDPFAAIPKREETDDTVRRADLHLRRALARGGRPLRRVRRRAAPHPVPIHAKAGAARPSPRWCPRPT